MPINPWGHTNPSQRRVASGSSQESQATQDLAAQPVHAEQAGPEGAGAAAASSSHAAMSSSRDLHLQRSLAISAKYHASLRSWMENAPSTERRARKEIVNRIMNWQNAAIEDEALDLSAESLHDEARIDEKITDLPPLPPRLQRLIVSGHRLRSLEVSKLPDSLEVLEAPSNELTELPAGLPSLRLLYVENNYLESLPEDLPDSLEDLNAANNQLWKLPARWPDSLEVLNVANNYLERLSEDFPDALEEVNAENNLLDDLPARWHDFAGELNVENNYLPEADDSVDETDDSVAGTDDSVEERDDSIGEVNSPPAEAENIYGVKKSSPTLGEAVRAWYGTRAPGHAVVWRDIRREAISKANPMIPPEELNKADEEELNKAHQDGRFTDPTAPFWTLLDSLNGTADAQTNSTFSERVTTLLDAMEDDKELRDRCFTIAHGAVETCHDNVTLGFNQMEEAHLARRVARGEFTPQEVFHLGVNAFKQDMLDALATQKAHEIGNEKEELIVVLYYRMRLANRLKLPHQSRDMTYKKTAITGEEGRIKNKDLYEAAEVVQSAARDPQKIIGFLMKWEPWQKDLARRYPEKFKDADLETAQTELKKQLDELMESDLDEGDKMREIETLQKGYDNLDETLFGPDRERLTREFMRGDVASGSGTK